MIVTSGSTPAPAAADRGSLPLAMLITMVAMSLSALLVPAVVNQVTATRTGAARTEALDAAQAGIDVALAHLRAAAGDDGDEGVPNGILENLPPCRLTGSVGPADAVPAVGYDVRIMYRDADSQAMACPPLAVPTTAVLTAVGTSSGGQATPRRRTIEATYKFRISNANTDGGAIRVSLPVANPLCMDSGSTGAPPPGRRLLMRRCVPGADRQRFAYTRSLTLQLVGSTTSTAPLGMCLSAASQTAGVHVLFQRCQEPVVASQQWSLNDVSNFRGTTDGVGVNGLCLNLRTAGLDGSEVVLGTCGQDDALRVFRSEAGVGAGMAGVATGQLVNYRQFSRCLDVTNLSPTWSSPTGAKYMIVWFCKQAPNGNVTWNQKWSFPQPAKADSPATGPIRSGNATSYCLKSPRSTAPDRYVYLEACATTGKLDDTLQWTVYGASRTYAQAYQITDVDGNCLTPTPLDVAPVDAHTDGTAKAKVAPCDGSELQKWNAPPNAGEALPLANIAER